jgi:hypothetical protein
VEKHIAKLRIEKLHTSQILRVQKCLVTITAFVRPIRALLVIASVSQELGSSSKGTWAFGADVRS